MSPPSSSPPRAHEILDRLVVWGQKLGLERIRSVLADLGDPQLAVPCVLIAGTNGKGSTSSALAAMLQASGYRTGLYNSPHLETVEERIRLQGRAIDSRTLGGLLERVVTTAERQNEDPPTYFEALTASAFLAFAEAPVDVAVMEVGLGGRLDATNVCEPVLSVISQIARDHQEHLGDTLAEIAVEKAGILRRDRSCVSWLSPPESADAIRRCARQLDVDLVDATRGVEIRAEPRLELDAEGRFVGERQDVSLSTPAARYRFTTRLRGAHQLDNLTLAVRSAEKLQSLGFERLETKTMEEGLSRARWPGRMEWVCCETVDGPLRVLLDGAHNGAGARALAQHVATLPLHFDLLFGALRRKNIDAVLPELAQSAENVVLTAPPSDRAQDPAELGALLDPNRFEVVVDCDRALERSLQLQNDRAESTALLVCGSLYLVGHVREALRRRFGVPEATTEIVLG
ncbi:MAG: folylpolyglutamate synthase/dihydrofolate synthase family protein [Acidobacteriota bacterium]